MVFQFADNRIIIKLTFMGAMQQNEVNSFYSFQAVYLQAASCHICHCQSSSLSDMISDCEQSFECVGGLSLNVIIRD